MQRSARLAVRSRGFLSMFGKEKAAAEPAKMTKEEQDKLRSALSGVRTDAPRSRASEVQAVDTEDIIDQQIDMDSIRARSLMQYRYNYAPPTSLKQLVLDQAKALIGNKSEGELSSFSLTDNGIKSKLIIAIGAKLKHFPLNSRLSSLKTVQDVLDFYSEPVENINKYTKMARSEKLPENVHVMEQPVRFHPEDTDAWHGGVTAFPGRGGAVIGLRNKRLLRQFKPKEEWFDYEDQTYGYSRPDKDMPWDPEIAERMDRYPNKRYNVRTKTFSRSTATSVGGQFN